MEPTTGTARMRRLPPAGLGPLLGTARLRAGYRLREAARLLELSPSYLVELEAGRRCPSRTVAVQLAEALQLTAEECEQLLAAAVDDAGRDHPARRAG